MPFVLLHLACLGVFLPGVELTWTAAGLLVGFYILRMFGITGVYHRYFSHRAYKTSRWFQFVLAWIGCSAMQKGPLWWAAHHRHHHLHSDEEEDIHSPVVQGLWWSHLGWVLSKQYEFTRWEAIHDFAKYPEIRWLDRWNWLPGLSVAAISWWVGGLSGLVYGFFVSTVLCYHATFCINSLAHVLGSVRYKTTDQSRNNFFLALITLGEGWHNNHHHYQSSARQGFFWWEIDGSYYILKLLSLVGLVWDLRPVPAHKLDPHAEPTPAATPAVVTPIGSPAASAVSAAAQVASSAAAQAAQAAQAAAAAATAAAATAAAVAVAHAPEVLAAAAQAEAVIRTTSGS